MQNQAEPLWKNLLRGGFAYETAYFGIHPLDRKRALKMFYLTLVEEVSRDEIKAEAEKYLQSRGVIPEGIKGHLKDVEKFYQSVKLPRLSKKAWLITWEYSSQDKPIEDRLIAVKSLRMNPARVAEFIEQYYMATQYTPYQKAFFSTRLSLNPYPAVFPNKNTDLEIYCGKDPKIYARIVKKLTIEIKDGKEIISWEEANATDNT